MPRKRRRGSGSGTPRKPAWSRGWREEPIVSKPDRRAADLLKVDAAWLAAEVERAGLVPWGQHSDGSPVFRWRELVALVEEVQRDDGKRAAQQAARGGAPQQEAAEARQAQAATRER